MMLEKKLSDAIFSVAWGYVLIHLHFNLGPFDILPDWLGYFLFFRAIKTIQKEQQTAKLLEPLAIILALWSIITIFLGNIEGVSLVVTVLSLYFHFQFLTDLANLADKYMCAEKSKLLMLRTVRTVLITVFAIPLPWEELGILSYILIIANIVVAFWICIVLFSLRKSLKYIEMNMTRME